MVKKKGGREINPADAHRKAERAKEIARNKKERQLQRAALKQRDDPETLREQLKEVIELEQAGKMNPSLRLKKKALQQAYDLAIKRKMEDDAAQLMVGRGLEEIAAEAMGRPEDSVFYHPTINPMGIPPPGKPQKYKTSGSHGSGAAASLPLPVPKQPPLPAGQPPPPPQPPPLPKGAAPLPGQPTGLPSGMAPLPPPPGPPPGIAGLASLRPPLGPPPGTDASKPLPPPPGPPPGTAGLASLWSPLGPSPGTDASKPLPPPPGPPPGTGAAAGAPVADASKQPWLPSPMTARMPPQGAFLPPPQRPPPQGVVAQPTGVELHALPTQFPALHVPPPSCGYEADQHQQRKAGQGVVISGKSTVVPLPKAHEDKRVTALVPASVRVRREQAPTRAAPKPAPSASGFGLVPRTLQQQRAGPAAAAMAAPVSVDDRVKDFLASLAGL